MDTYHVDITGGNANVGPGGTINNAVPGGEPAVHRGVGAAQVRDPVVVLVALEVERDGMAGHLANIKPWRHPAGTVFEVGTLAAAERQVVLATTGMGNRASAAIGERAIAAFHPRVLLFTGIAGGLRDDLLIGDVVVADRVYAYQTGKETDGRFLVRPHSWPASHGLVQLARHAARANLWSIGLRTAGLRSPVVQFSPIAAGEVVVDSRGGGLAEQIRRHYNDAAAVDMESAGAYQAAHLNTDLEVLAIRGISDHADGEKQATDKGGWQRVAAANAAAFTCALIALIDREPLA